MMRGARKAARLRLLAQAEATRAAGLDTANFEKWVAAVSGRDRHLPPEALAGVLAAGSAQLAKISMAEALKRMH